jgi:hypothetical protein
MKDHLNHICIVILLFTVFLQAADLPAQEAISGVNEGLWVTLRDEIAHNNTTKFQGSVFPTASFIEGVPLVKQVDGITTSYTATMASVVRLFDKRNDIEIGVNFNNRNMIEWFSNLNEEEKKNKYEIYIKRKKALENIKNSQFQNIHKHMTLGITTGKLLELYINKTKGDCLATLKLFLKDRGYELKAAYEKQVSAINMMKSINDKHPIILTRNNHAFLVIGYLVDSSKLHLCAVDPMHIEFIEIPREGMFKDENIKKTVATMDKKYGPKKFDNKSDINSIPQKGIKLITYVPGEFDVIIINDIVATEKSIGEFMTD